MQGLGFGVEGLSVEGVGLWAHGRSGLIWGGDSGLASIEYHGFWMFICRTCWILSQAPLFYRPGIMQGIQDEIVDYGFSRFGCW